MLSSTCVDAYGRIGGALVCGLRSRYHSDGAWGLFGPTLILIDIHGASGHSLGMFENMTTRSASNTIVQAKHIYIYIYIYIYVRDQLHPLTQMANCLIRSPKFR